VCSQEKSCQGWDSPDKHNMEQEDYWYEQGHESFEERSTWSS
jgi:hypothetical protein